MPIAAYLMVFLLPTLAGVGVVLGGGWVWLQPMVMYGLIPLIELGINGTTDNLPYEGDSHRRNHWIARLILMLLFPFQLLLVLHNEPHRLLFFQTE